MRKTESQKIALCGMLGALSVVILLLGSALQIGTYAAPMLAAFWGIGIALGFTLQRARFCFTAAMREALLDEIRKGKRIQI